MDDAPRDGAGPISIGTKAAARVAKPRTPRPSRSSTFAAISRMHFTRARVQLILRHLRQRLGNGQTRGLWVQGPEARSLAPALAPPPSAADFDFEPEEGEGAATATGTAGEGDAEEEGTRKSPRDTGMAGSAVGRGSEGADAESVRAEDARRWSRARMWKFQQLLKNFSWRIGQRAAGRWVIAPPSAQEPEPEPQALRRPKRQSASRRVAASAAEREQGRGAAASAAAGSNSKDALPQGRDTVDVLEVLLPDPSADSRGIQPPRRGAEPARAPEPELVWLEVLAQEDVDAVLHALYIDPAAGASRGARALYERSLLQYVGIHMSAVAAFLARQETKQAVHPKLGHLVEQPSMPSAPNAEWEVDLAQVLLPTRTLHRYICSVIDVFSRFAWVVALDTNDGDQVAAALQTLFLSEGAPEKLRSDGGGDVDNAAVSALCTRFLVKRSLCRSHNSECNGMVERLHRTVKESLVRQTSEWSSAAHTVDSAALLPSILHAYNTTAHNVTRFTPFFLYRGRKPRALGEMQLLQRSVSAGVAAGLGLRAGEGGGLGLASCVGARAIANATTERALKDAPVDAALAAMRPNSSAGSSAPANAKRAQVAAAAAGPRWIDVPVQVRPKAFEQPGLRAQGHATPSMASASAPHIKKIAAAPSSQRVPPSPENWRNKDSAGSRRGPIPAAGRPPLQIRQEHRPPRRQTAALATFANARAADADAHSLHSHPRAAVPTRAHAPLAPAGPPGPRLKQGDARGPASAPVASRGDAASASASASASGGGGKDEATYDIQQVLAMKRDPQGKVSTWYWVRWLGYGADQDSWIPSKLAGKGDSEAQFELWIRQNQPYAPPIEFLGPMRVPPKQAMTAIPVQEEDWAQLDAVLAARDRGVVPRGRGLATDAASS